MLRKKKIRNYYKAKKIIDSCETASQVAQVMNWLMKNRRIFFTMKLYNRAFKKYLYLCEMREYLTNKEAIKFEETNRFISGV